MADGRHPRRWAVLALVVLAAVAAAVWWASVAGEGWPWARLEDAPSAVAGQAAPALTDAPLTRLAVAGDTGTGADAQYSTARAMAAQAASHAYDGLLLLGDLIYEDGDAALVEEVITDPFAPVLDAGAELLPVLGNHDYRSGEQDQIMTALGRDGSWYVDHLGTLRIVALDSNRVDDPDQTRWLREVLAEPQPAGTWTVAAMHHPAYSAGHHGSDLAVRRTWGPLFAEAGVPLVLAGHDHDYQRATPQDGVTYVVSGAGAKRRPVGREEFTAVSASTLHYLDLLVYDDRLVGRAIDQSGRLVDLFTLSR